MYCTCAIQASLTPSEGRQQFGHSDNTVHRHPVWLNMQVVSTVVFCCECHCVLHLPCRCAIYVQDICSIITHIISRAQKHQRPHTTAEQAESSNSNSGCVVAYLPHCIYNMVNQGRQSAVLGFWLAGSTLRHVRRLVYAMCSPQHAQHRRLLTRSSLLLQLINIPADAVLTMCPVTGLVFELSHAGWARPLESA